MSALVIVTRPPLTAPDRNATSFSSAYRKDTESIAMKNIDNVFVVTKPLQLMVALSIIEQLNIPDASTIIIVSNFHGSNSVFQRILRTQWYFSGVRFYLEDNNPNAYRRVARIRPRNLYVDGDVGVRRHVKFLFMKLFKLNLNLYVYEEGVGTYRADIYRGLKKVMLSCAGVATFFGGGLVTKKIFVYQPSKYRRNFPKYRKENIVQIEPRLQDFVLRYFSSLQNIFNYYPKDIPKDRICNVYVTSWHPDYDFINSFDRFDGDKFIKPHPHIRNFQRPITGTIIERSAPAELVFLDLARKYAQLNIFHHGSSVEMYLDAPNIAFFHI